MPPSRAAAGSWRLFDAAATVCSAACVASLWLSLRSYAYSDTITLINPRGLPFGTYHLESQAGLLRFSIWHSMFDALGHPVPPETVPRKVIVGTTLGRSSVPPPPQRFQWATIPDTVLPPPAVVRLGNAPHWAAAALAAVLPAAWLGMRLPALLRADRRSSQGLCAACGYDLRASGERCPECGTPVPPALPVVARPRRTHVLAPTAMVAGLVFAVLAVHVAPVGGTLLNAGAPEFAAAAFVMAGAFAGGLGLRSAVAFLAYGTVAAVVLIPRLLDFSPGRISPLIDGPVWWVALRRAGAVLVAGLLTAGVARLGQNLKLRRDPVPAPELPARQGP